MSSREEKIIRKCAELCEKGMSSEALRYVDQTMSILSNKTEKLIQSLNRMPV